jgi:hypothetical protein
MLSLLPALTCGCGSDNSNPLAGQGGTVADHGGAAGSGGTGASTGGAAGTRGGGTTTSNGGASGSGGSSGESGTAGTGTGGGGGPTDGGGESGAAGSAEATPDAAIRDALPDAVGPTDDAGPFSCLPKGQEKLIIRITGGTPTFSVTTPDDMKCLSRYLPATDQGSALLDFNWNVGAASMSVIVRLDDVVPGQTGMFTPFAVAISEGSNSWTGTAGKCHVTVSSSDKLGARVPPPGTVYKVAGAVACDHDWALGKPNDVVEQFDFATRVVAP